VDSSIDIVVVGAGVIGCATAYELARRGAAVQLVDDRPAGMGATQASAGVLAPFIEAREGGPLLELTAQSLDRFDAFVERVTADSRMSLSYRRTGSLDVASDDESLGNLTATADLLSARGIAAELLDRNGVRSEEPQLTHDVRGGLLIPSHGFVAAVELTRALVAAARRHGAHLLEQGRVRRVRETPGGLVVETERGSLTGHRVVVAAGSWSGQIEIDGADRVPVRPVRGQLLHLTGTGPALKRVVWGERCYMVPWSDGTLLVGATMEDAGFDERTTVSGVRGLLDAASALVPNICKFSFQAAKVGLRPGTPDGLPVIGASAVIPAVTYATGHYRNGILLAPLTAELVADSLMDNRISPLLEATRPGRFGKL
jgi:glycine oxidase